LRCRRAIRWVSILEPELLLAALETLFKSDDARQRTVAALVAVSVSLPANNSMSSMGPIAQSGSSSAHMPTSPGEYRAILEYAVSDMSLKLDQREAALQALNSMGARGPLRRCGLELARQLSKPSVSSRVAAAKLLHRIDPSILAGINIPDETP
jgi:hypothetical protein